MVRTALSRLISIVICIEGQGRNESVLKCPFAALRAVKKKKKTLIHKEIYGLANDMSTECSSIIS